MQVMEPLSSFHLGGLCACQSKGRANDTQLEPGRARLSGGGARSLLDGLMDHRPPAPPRQTDGSDDRRVSDTSPAGARVIYTFRHAN